MSQGPIVTRFAPSPTGHLHIGGARSALFCWAFAKRAELEHQARGGRPGDGGGGGGGRFMIRIEDTDQARSSEESARGILADLQWLGILNDLGPYIASDGTIREHDWPGGRPGSSPYFQAKRVPIYNAYIESLIKSGRAYPAFETSETLDAKRRASIAQKQTYRYDRAEYHRLATPEQRLDAMRESDAHRGFANLPWSGPKPETLNPKPETRPYVIRFAMDADPVIVHDQVLGDVKTAAGEVDDFVIRKADGFPTYHFAVVIDDELMGVTHILRAQEHLANTPRHVAMQRALSRLPEHGGPAPFRTPIYAHMPLIFNMDGTKMSKRDKAKVARAALRRFEAVFSEDEMFARFERVWLETKDAPDHDFSSLDKTVTFGQFREGKDEFRDGRNDSPFWAWVVSRMLDIQLPEIEVSDFRAAGYLPEAITNFIALLGWNPGMKLPDGKDLEKFDMDFLAKHFAIDRIGKTNAKFDRAKLLSFNADYIGKLSDADFAARWRSFLAEYEPNILAALNRGSGASPGTPTPTIDARFALLSSVLKPRAKTLRDAITSARFAIVADTGYDFDPKALEKLRAASGRELLTAARTALAAQPDASWTPSAIHAALETLAKDLNLGIHNAAVGKLAQPLRIAVTGTGVSPGIAETLAILGKNSTLARIDRCLAFLS